ncbi:MAG: competence/damage-inducible protein A [Candidatus Omnitrophota bacterium]
MNAEIISIGTELLLGHIVNTNAAYIAEGLASIGVDHYYQTTVGDNPRRLADTLLNALERSDVVILTGGLGPTIDDVTTQTIADAFKRRLVLDAAALKDIKEFFKRLRRDVPKISLRQALIPEGATTLKNRFGTAPGIVLKEGGHIVIALPGPPREMQPMMTDLVLPYVRSLHREAQILKTRSLRIIGMGEPYVNERVKDFLSLSGPVRLGIYAKQGEVELKIMAKAPNDEKASAEIMRLEKIIRQRFGGHLYGADSETLAGIVGSLLNARKKSIAVAESCTGGLLANVLTNVSGSSGYFHEGVITYSNESKVRYLGVSAPLIKKCGAVSDEVARQMALGIRAAANSDIGVGITGIAGPTGATKNKPVGLVYIALSTDVMVICKEFRFAGSRTEIKHQASQAALNMVRLQFLAKQKR